MGQKADETNVEPTGHWQVVQRRRRRVIKAYWTDAEGKHGGTLGPAHVKDSGRRTPLGATVWRAGDGPKPSAEHLTPKDADARLADILRGAPRAKRATTDRPTLRAAYEAHIAERRATRGLRRSTLADYDTMAARLYRDLGAETPLEALTTDDLHLYFSDFKAESPIGSARAERMHTEGHDVCEVTNDFWIAWESGAAPIEVATKDEATRIADERGWSWKHRAPGAYRVTPPGGKRGKRVGAGEATMLTEAGWLVERRARTHWVVRTPAAPQTRNKYRDFLGAICQCAIARGWIEDNPVSDVRRSSRRQDRQRILRRDDFYDNDQVARLLANVDDPVDEAFFLGGFHGGLRLPGEGLGLRWGAVDFDAGVVRPYDSWVRNALDATKTANVAPIPMTPRWRAALDRVRARGWRTADDDHVFTRDPSSGHPADERELRETFRRAAKGAGLKPIPMYNSRHSFGTALARGGVNIRTISALMRHERLATTEIYMAYSPQTDLAAQMTRALEAMAPVDAVAATGATVEDLFAALVDEIPPKWLREVERVYGELVDGSPQNGQPASPERSATG